MLVSLGCGAFFLPRPCTPAGAATQCRPLAVASPVRAPICLPVASSALRTPQRYSTAKPNPERTPGAPDQPMLASSQPCAAAETQSRRAPPPPALASFVSRPIRSVRARLDRVSFRSEPLDQDPTAHEHRYRFAMVFLLKSPRTLLKPTRGPRQFRSISRWVLFLSL